MITNNYCILLFTIAHVHLSDVTFYCVLTSWDWNNKWGKRRLKVFSEYFKLYLIKLVELKNQISRSYLWK